LIKDDYHLGDIGRRFDTALGTLQRDDDAFRISQLHATDTADEGDAYANHTVGTEKSFNSLMFSARPTNLLIDAPAVRPMLSPCTVNG
jgi:hypothetical protein